MRERGIIMQGESVRAIDDGRKTQTRRLLSPQPEHLQHHEWRGETIIDQEHRLWCWKQHTYDNIWDFGEHSDERKHLAKLCPYGAAGDCLWIKESWQTGTALDGLTPFEIGGRSIDAGYSKPWAPIRFVADGRENNSDTLRDFGGAWGRVRGPLHLPRWASRLTIEVTEVRVQRLQEISEDDARAEGCHRNDAAVVYQAGTRGLDRDLSWTARGAYAVAWDAINGKRRRRELIRLGERGYPGMRTVTNTSARWVANPWVWAITFRRLP